METFSKNLKFLREEKGLNQSELAKKIGLRQSHISSWELNTSDPSLYNISLIADYFNVSIDYLIGREFEDGTIIINNAKQNLSNKNMVYILDNLCNEYNYKLSEEISNALITILKNLKG